MEAVNWGAINTGFAVNELRAPRPQKLQDFKEDLDNDLIFVPIPFLLSLFIINFKH